MVEIKSVNEDSKTVTFDDGETVTYDGFIQKFYEFWNKRIAGETVTHVDFERFINRSSARNLKLLMKGKKMEGYLEGSMDKFLTKGQKIAVTTFAVIGMMAIIAFVVLKNQGII